MEGNHHTSVVSNKPTTQMWSVIPGLLSNWLRWCERVKTSCPFTEPLAPVKFWTTETRWQSAKHTLKKDLWLIQNKLPPEVAIKDPSVSRWLVRRLYRACSVSRWTWELTEANVSVWPCPAPPVLWLHLWALSQGRSCCEGVLTSWSIPVQQRWKHWGSLCWTASPFHLILPELLSLCFYVKSLLHMMHWY